MDSKLLNSGTPHRAAGSPYLCRCRWWRRGWRRSCTPAPWCGRRAASGCSPRSAAWRRPCSSRSRPAPAPRPGRTAARRPGTGRRRGTESREPAGRAERSGERRHRRAVIPSPPPVKPRGRHLPGGPGRAGRPPARGELPQSPCLSGAERERSSRRDREAGPARSEAAAGATAFYGSRGRRVRLGADVARSGPRPRPALAASQECGWRAARPLRPAPSPGTAAAGGGSAAGGPRVRPARAPCRFAGPGAARGEGAGGPLRVPPAPPAPPRTRPRYAGGGGGERCAGAPLGRARERSRGRRPGRTPRRPPAAAVPPRSPRADALPVAVPRWRFGAGEERLGFCCGALSLRGRKCFQMGIRPPDVTIFPYLV